MRLDEHRVVWSGLERTHVEWHRAMRDLVDDDVLLVRSKRLETVEQFETHSRLGAYVLPRTKHCRPGVVLRIPPAVGHGRARSLEATTRKSPAQRCDKKCSYCIRTSNLN